MATESVDQRAAHIRGITVTALASIAGILAAIASNMLAASATDSVGLYILVGAIIAQFPILKLVGIEVDDFSAKDYIYVGFMTFSLWFVSWGVLLTAETKTTIPF